MIEEETAADRAAETFEYYGDNRESLALFLMMATQWRVVVGARGVWTGIDYASLHATINAMRLPRDKRIALFHDVRVMERAAIPILNAKKEDDGG